MTVSKQLIENVEELRKALNEISVYDFDVYTSMELYYKIANKLNEVIKELMRFEGLVSDEVIKQNEKLIYLLGEGLYIEVVKKINQMVQDGTFDSIINHNLFNSLNKKIDDYKEELIEQIKENEKKTNERIFKPKFGISAYWGEVSNTTGGSYTSTLENMKNDIEIWKAHGVDEVVIPLHIGFNELTNDIFLGENLELIKQGCQEIINNGLKIACIKVHVMRLTSKNAESMGDISFNNKYTKIIKSICETFNDLSVEYIYPFNEVSWIYNNENKKEFTLNVINLCRNYGYKVSISTAGAEESFIMSSDIHHSLDAISVNYYQHISAKNSIKNIDGFNSWKGSSLLHFAHYFKNKYRNKEFIVSETGVNDYKEALISPETSFGTERNNGVYQDIYLNGVFNCLNNSSVDRVWWWFGFDSKNNITSKTTNYFLGRAKYEF